MTLDAVIFVTSAVVAVFGATMMISQRNPVASVMYFILSLVAQAVLYVQLGSVFMGAVLIIVYAGAILVLFLFVIMLLNLRGTEDLGGPSPAVSRWSKYLVSVLLIVEIVFAIRSGFRTEATGGGIAAGLPHDAGSVEAVAELLFTRYLYPFELTSILLLAAIVGAVVLARQARAGRPSMSSVSDEDAPQAAREVRK